MILVNFSPYVVKNETTHFGHQIIVKFPNNYGASIINNLMSYGTELAVLMFDENGDWNITYTTPITDNVIGYIENMEELESILTSIFNLPPPVGYMTQCRIT